MKYWAILVGKLFAALAVLYPIWLGLHAWYEPPAEILRFNHNPFGHDLEWTTIMFVYNLVCCAVLVLIILDQKYRCRTCGRRLRMPVSRGNHSRLLLAPPRTEYICLYGHGTLTIPDTQLTGPEPVDWKQHRDIWSELFEAERKN